MLKQIEQNDARMRDIEAEIEKLEEIVKDLRYKVEIVEDRLQALKYKEEKILTAYYIEGRTAEDIGNHLYFELFKQTRSDRNIQRTIDKALEKMLKL